MLDSQANVKPAIFEKSKQRPALILNADYRPLSYFPLSLWPWQEAIKAVYLKRVNVAAEYEEVVRSEKLTLPLPSVIVLKNYVVPTKTVPFTRATLFLRDEFTCQYCGYKGKDLTFDHVVPKSRGGKTRWDNVVAACQSCNLRKAAKTTSQAGFKLKKAPIKPSPEVLLNKGKKFPPSDMHKSWSDFLYFEKDFD
jgi:5-methylcytosine-specific restriction endonuclease McrA|tara:strand:- start:324 stop:908 length:585 start_codon:yes stop_codon:yes gene_type:complete